MLKGIPVVLSPDLLKILAEMGHGDEIVIGDSNFPSCSMGQRVIRADGISGTDMLKAILKLMPLDTYSTENYMLMNTTNGDPIPTIWAKYDQIVEKNDKNPKKALIERQAFYERSKKAYAVIATGETALYACVILRKGVL